MVSITLTATNTDGISASETFAIADMGLDTPAVSAQTAPQSVYGRHALSLAGASAFSDPLGEALTFTATLATGAALPAWLTLDLATGVFSGTPPSVAQTVAVRLTATNKDGASASETITIADLGLDTPVLTAQTPAQVVYSGHQLGFSAAGAFSDPLMEALTFRALLSTGAALPSWIACNATTGMFSGTAPAGVQTVNVQVIATNSDGGSAVENFTIADAGTDTPRLTAQTPGQSIYAGHTLALSAAGAFIDPGREALSFRATLTNGAALPYWISFNTATGAFAGVAPPSAQTVGVKVTATNPDGVSASETFTIADQGLDTPVLAAQTLAQKVYSSHALSFSVANAFIDPFNQALTYKATMSNGSALPSWIGFNPASRAFSVLAPNTSQTVSVMLSATNTDGWSASEIFTIADQTDVPSLAVQTVDQSVYLGHTFSLTVPGNTFADPAGETLTLSATLSNGQALPSWLAFNPSTGNFSGTAPGVASATSVRMTATNTDGQSVAETFTWNDKADTLTLAAQTGAQNWITGQPVSLAIPAGTFADAAGETLTYSAAQSNGAALPAGLIFNAANDSFSGSAPITAQTLSLKVTATDTDHLACSETVMVFIAADLPSVTRTTANQTVVDGQNFSLPVTTAFLDPKGSPLTYAANEISGPNASSWLRFGNGALSGIVPATGSATMGIRVTATNAFGMSATETFGVAYAKSGSTAPSAAYTNASPAVETIALHG